MLHLFSAFYVKYPLALVNYLRKEIIEALAKHGFNVDDKALKPRSPSKSASSGGHIPRHTIALRDVDCPPIRYRVRDGGALFLHRKSCFEAVGLERVVMTQGRCSALS